MSILRKYMNMLNESFDLDDDDEEYVSPYPEGTLEAMSAEELKAERLAQIDIADEAELDSPEEELAQSKLIAVLLALDARGIRIR